MIIHMFVFGYLIWALRILKKKDFSSKRERAGKINDTRMLKSYKEMTLLFLSDSFQRSYYNQPQTCCKILFKPPNSRITWYRKCSDIKKPQRNIIEGAVLTIFPALI